MRNRAVLVFAGNGQFLSQETAPPNLLRDSGETLDMPIPDTVLPPEKEQVSPEIPEYELQNRYCRACIRLAESETEEERKEALISAETALLALEEYWRVLDAKKEK